MVKLRYLVGKRILIKYGEEYRSGGYTGISGYSGHKGPTGIPGHQAKTTLVLDKDLLIEKKTLVKKDLKDFTEITVKEVSENEEYIRITFRRSFNAPDDEGYGSWYLTENAEDALEIVYVLG